MFVMTADIQIGRYRGIRPSEVTWHCSAGNFTDTCTVTLPLSAYVKTTQPVSDGAVDARLDTVRVSAVTSCLFKAGDPVRVRLGYNGNDNRVFEGFVQRVNMADGLMLECEGYSSQLRDLRFRKSYRETTLRQILADLTQDTDIRLSDRIDTLALTNVTFDNATGIQVLEWLQKECACRVFFNFDTLYAGASQYTVDNGSIDIRLGWNTVSADELKRDISEDVQINIVEKNAKGTVKRTREESRKYRDVKEVRVRQGLDAGYLRRALRELQEDENARGYKGAVTLFLEPCALKGMVCNVTDRRFPERNGRYFIEEVEGSFGSGGGRQKIKLKNYGNVQ